MVKKAFLLVTILFLTGGSLLYADSAFSNMKFYFNNKQLGISFIDDNKSYRDFVDIAKSFRAIVEKSDQKLQLYKPNVNVTLFDKDNNIFGGVNMKKGSRTSFSALLQVDALKTDVSDLRIDITAPGADTTTIQAYHFSERSKERFWFRTNDFTYNFDNKGIYPIQVYFKDSASDEWFCVAEIQIEAQ